MGLKRNKKNTHIGRQSKIVRDTQVSKYDFKREEEVVCALYERKERHYHGFQQQKLKKYVALMAS